MRFDTEKKHVTDVFFALSLFGVFAVTALLSVVIGANVYRSTAESMKRTGLTRTPLAYVAEKVRQNDVTDGLSVEQLDGTEALVLHNSYEGTDYDTYIYALDGSLRELSVNSSLEPQKEAGQVISDIQEFSVEKISGGLYQVTVSDETGEEFSLYISPKCS